MTKVTIDRDLLEQVTSEFEHDNDRYMLGSELRKVLDAPRQPEGEAISRERVQAEADAFFDWPTTDKSSVTTTSCLIFARCIAGMVAAERDATIAELRGECSFLKDCQENAMLHMTGLVAERDTLRQQLAERDAEIERLRVKLMTIASAEPSRHTIEWAKAMAATGNNEVYAKWREAFDQCDKLAGLLRELHAIQCLTGGYEETALALSIDAALAEVGK